MADKKILCIYTVFLAIVMSLWLCVRFPLIALESLANPSTQDEVSCGTDKDEQPVIVLERQRVIACNSYAANAGIEIGHSAQTASALLNNHTALLLERDVEAEQRTLTQLQSWAYSMTPTLEIWRTDCLQLEIGGCLKLHRGLNNLIEQIQRDLRRRGYTGMLGLASNRHAAWLLSYASADTAINIDSPLSERLAALPPSLIGTDWNPSFKPALDNLYKAGIRTMGEILAMPTSAVGKRCGKHFLDWLSALNQLRDDAHQNYQPPPQFLDTLWFGFDIKNSAELKPAMAQLLTGFSDYLRNTQRYTDTLEWQLLRMRGPAKSLVIRSQEARENADKWLSLSMLNLERVTIPEGIEGLSLWVEALIEPPALAEDLFAERRSNEPLQDLIDRLRSRLGLNAVTQLELRDAHLPEHCLYACLTMPNALAPPKNQAQRPFWLMQEAQLARQEQGVLYWNGPLDIIYGPERIEDHWWEQPVSRDYYIARQSGGQPLWLYQDRHSRLWYVHGMLP